MSEWGHFGAEFFQAIICTATNNQTRNNNQENTSTKKNIKS